MSYFVLYIVLCCTLYCIFIVCCLLFKCNHKQINYLDWGRELGPVVRN